MSLWTARRLSYQAPLNKAIDIYYLNIDGENNSIKSSI